MPNKVSSIVIFARRWFNRRAGNTYFTATIYVNGDFFKYLPRQDGYGSHYLDVSKDVLFKAGLLPYLKINANGSSDSLYYHCKEHDINFIAQVADVGKKSDL